MFREAHVMITGANGFLGSHLARALLEQGAHVDGLSRGENQAYLDAFHIADQVSMHRADIVAKGRIAEIFSRCKYDYVFHLASQSDTWKSTRKPMETFRVNVDGTLNVLEAVRKSRCSPRVVIGGSVRVFQHAAVNGDQSREATLHPYDASKLAMEAMALSYFHAYGISGAVARNTNIYGPNDLKFSRLVPLIMKGIITDGKIRLRGNGLLSRDFLYAEDAVDGMMRLALRLNQSNVRGRAFAFATSQNHTIRKLCELIQRHSPRPFEVEWDASNPMKDREQSPMDISRTKETLGWIPKVGLDLGIQKTLSWYQLYFERVGNTAARVSTELVSRPAVRTR